MNRDDGDYFAQRERSERAAAKLATCPQARRAHQELAQNYAERRRREARLSNGADNDDNIAGQPRCRLTIIAEARH